MLIHPKGKSREIFAGVSVILVVVGVALLVSSVAQAPEGLPESPLDNDLFEPATRGVEIGESAPVRLRIPSIGVDTHFVALGIQENQEIEIPSGFEEVGWYEHGPTPGEIGPAIILGHVDSTSGPAVFYSLGQVNVGEIVEIDRRDGTTARFRIDGFDRYPQSSFPTSLVYGDIDHAGLRLITCSGSYNSELQRYDHNLVVYASLIE